MLTTADPALYETVFRRMRQLEQAIFGDFATSSQVPTCHAWTDFVTSTPTTKHTSSYFQRNRVLSPIAHPMFSPLLTISLAFAPSPMLFHTRLTSTSVVSMKKGAADNDDSRDERVMPKVDVGSICEFHDPKHGSGSAPPVLGVVKGVEFKAKGGARIMLTDADGNQHAVAEKALHITLPYKGKATEPAEILKEYTAAMEAEPSEYVEPELLELAWSVCAESDVAAFSPKSILSIIDEKLCKSNVDKYKAL